MKTVKTPFYNYIFNEKTGLFKRWGTTAEDDPQYSPIGPEILDIEISTICSHGCKFCYKSNVKSGKNMAFDTFKHIFDSMPTLTQIAFGIGDINANPDMWKMFEYCRANGVVPNLTINGDGLTDEIAKDLVSYLGACAISHYSDDNCFNAVEKLTSLGMKQINIHKMLSEETYESTLNLLKSIKEDKRLVSLNAVVFLSLKQKGRGEHFTPLSFDKFKFLSEYCLKNNVRFGFDSCSANKFIKVIENTDYKYLTEFVEPCESGCFSYYINVDGMAYPCSFTENEEVGLDMTKDIDFLQDIWYNPSTITWRKKLIKNCRSCPVYSV